MMNELDDIKAGHIPAGNPADPHCASCSDSSYPIWPCDAVLALNEANRLASENDTLGARIARLEDECVAANLEAAQYARERDALRATLEEYGERENWWQARHISGDPFDSFGDIPRMVWSWDDMREPWTMAQKALAAAARPDQRAAQDATTSGEVG